MISLRLRVLLFIVQTTSIHVRGSQEQSRSDASPDTMRYAAKNATSFLISSSVLQHSNHHHTFLDSTSILATQSGSDGHNFLGSRSSHLTYLQVLVTLNTITQSTSAFTNSSAPETLVLWSEISRNTNTELLSKARTSLVAWDKKSTVYNDSQVISTSMVDSSEQLHLMTLNVTRHSASVHGLTTHATNHSLKHSSFLTNIYSGVSSSQDKTRTEIIQKESTTQTKLNALSRSTTNSFPLESSKAYQTNILHTKSVEQSAQISRSSSNITTLQRKNISTSASSLLYLTNSYEHSSHVFRTSSNNRHSPPSSTNTVEKIASTMSRHVASSLSTDKNGSYLSTISYLFSSSILNSLDYYSQINPTPALTRFQNISKTILVKKITKTLSIVPSTTLINTAPILMSASDNAISQSSHSVGPSVRSEQGRTKKSDPNSSSTINNGGKPEIIQPSSLSIIIHSLQLSQKPASETVIKHSPKYSDRNPSMPIYVLAIFLPLALLLGFVLAFLYFKRSKLYQRTQYSVTVEVTSECPDYEMKRMYSVIDMNAGNINKDFWSGLESDNSTSSILSSVSLKPATDDQKA